MHYQYRVSGVCPSMVEFDLDGDIARNIKFTGGCNGNLKAVATLVDGMTVDEIIEKVQGIKCGFKSTSCPDQLAAALIEYKESAN